MRIFGNYLAVEGTYEHPIVFCRNRRGAGGPAVPLLSGWPSPGMSLSWTCPADWTGSMRTLAWSAAMPVTPPSPGVPQRPPSRRPVRGALPYATAKAAVEGLTRAAAVDHGPDRIRTNAVALGSISTARLEEYRAAHPETDGHMAALHPRPRWRALPGVPALFVVRAASAS